MRDEKIAASLPFIATVDVGTNTALLLVSGWRDGKLVVKHDETRFVRLGEGVDAAGRIKEAAIRRLCDTLAYYQGVAAREGAGTMIVGATSASRDAGNREAVVETVRRETGLIYEILSGEEEAFWSFRGALSGLDPSDRSYLVVDIGGGSTELVRGALQLEGAAIHHAVSLDLGSVRMTERFFSSLPPEPDEVSRAIQWVQSLLHPVPPFDPGAALLVGASGTTTSLAVLEYGLDRVPVDLPLVGDTISLARVEAWRRRLLKLTDDQVLSLNPTVMKGRSDVFPAGVLILELIMKHLGAREIAVSIRGLRHGLALRHRERDYGVDVKR